MKGQTKAFIGIGTSPWHRLHKCRVRFVAQTNGREEVVIGVIRHVSPTGALLKVSRELENDQGKPTTRMTEYPTSVVKPGSLRELRPGDQGI